MVGKARVLSAPVNPVLSTVNPVPPSGEIAALPSEEDRALSAAANSVLSTGEVLGLSSEEDRRLFAGSLTAAPPSVSTSRS